MSYFDKHKHHLFLEDNDATPNNSFILSVNNLNLIKDDLTFLTGHTQEIITVAESIDSINAINSNLSAINGVYNIKDYIPLVAGHVADISTVTSNLDTINLIKDNIGIIADFQNVKSYLPTIAAYSEKISTVANNINTINSIYEDRAIISNVNNRIADVKSFNDNINNGQVDNFVNTLVEALDTTSNRWATHIQQIGQSIITSAGAHNWEAVTTITQNVPADTVLILPDLMQYKPETHMLIVSYNGTLVYENDGYEEVGNYEAWSTRVKIKFPLTVGDKLCFRTIGISCSADTEGNLWAERLTTLGSNTVTSVENARLAAIRDVDNTKDTIIANINTLGTNYLQDLDTARSTNITNINTAGNNQYQSINTLGGNYYQSIETIGNSILATISASNAFYTYEIVSPVTANTNITLPNNLRYKVGTFMLMVSYNGVLCYPGDQYEEVGIANEFSTTITIKFDLKTGDKLGFRILAMADLSELMADVANLKTAVQALQEAASAGSQSGSEESGEGSGTGTGEGSGSGSEGGTEPSGGSSGEGSEPPVVNP